MWKAQGITQVARNVVNAGRTSIFEYSGNIQREPERVHPTDADFETESNCTRAESLKWA